MNAIVGFSSLLADNFENKAKLTEYTKIITSRSNDLLAIINDILDISKIESGQIKLNIEKCNIFHLFNELSSHFKEQQQYIEKEDIALTFSTNITNQKGFFLSDKIKLEQILANLIGNAYKFTNSGKIECGCSIKDKELLFYVSDTGIGIPSDKYTEVFERFTQLKPEKNKVISGTGLGLSIVKGLISLFNGKIWIESELGKGSTFFFSIPYMPPDSDNINSDTSPKTNNTDFSEKTVLIVEDDQFNAEYLKEILRPTGLTILHTFSGKEAIDIALKNTIDIILMDIRLPDMNGYETTRIIKNQKPNIIIIAQTAYASQNEHIKAISIGCNAYISKPTPKEKLLNIISKQLHD